MHTINFCPEDHLDTREKCQTEAAHVLASLSYGELQRVVNHRQIQMNKLKMAGPAEVVIALLEAGAVEGLLNALANSESAVFIAVLLSSS